MSKLEQSEIILRLFDLQEQSERWQKKQESVFLTEEEFAQASKRFPASDVIRYDGGYPDARRKKIIFLPFPDDTSEYDIVCVQAKVDDRFRKLTHRDILGTLMALRIERSHLGDMWVKDGYIYIYTTHSMARFIVDQCTRIANQSVQFEIIEDHPVQVFEYRHFEKTAASQRADAIVAAIANISRAQAKEMIRHGYVQLDHVTLEEPDEVCHNNVTISIRGIGRFVFVKTLRQTKKDRIVAEFLQYQ